MGTHTEVLRVHFDPERISLSEILDLFWSSHDPKRSDRGTQYRAILACESDAQQLECQASARDLEKHKGVKVATPIVIGTFHRAEDYHQKWKLRQRRDIYAELLQNYGSEAELHDSVAATKLNAYAAGHGTPDQIERDLPACGLSPRAADALRPRRGSGRGR